LILKGILDIANDDQQIIGSFLIEIHCSPDFPFGFPLLYETGKSIKTLAKWHKFPDDRCCITVLPDEILKCKAGISVLSFIRKYAVPYFANFIHRQVTGQYKNGEYEHTPGAALRQFYSELLKTSDPVLWDKYLDMTFYNQRVPCGRNEKCFCGSEKKYKVCHHLIFELLKQVGEKQVTLDFLEINAGTAE
jgi:hypothetical protein